MLFQDENSQTVLERAAKGYSTTLLSQAVRLACKAVSVLVLARIITPAEHGVFAMAASLTLVLVLFRDLGLGAAALQAAELSEEQKTSLFWAHAGLGLVLTFVTLALAPIMAAFYCEPRVQPLLYVMSASMLLLGINAWPRVLLARELQFAKLNRLETTAILAATGASIAAGLVGAGPYSFATFLLVSEGIILVAAWRVCRWRPRGGPRWGSLRQFWQSGSHLTSHGLLVSILQQIDPLLMGKFFGPHALGLYTRPNQLLFLPLTHIAAPLGHVLLATLARLGTASTDFAQHVRDTANLIAHLTLPLAAICLVVPTEIVRLLLGTAWPEAAPLLRWLAISAVTSSLTATVYPVCVAAGQTRRLVAMSAFAVPVVLAGACLGMGRGPVGLAAGVAIANVVLLVPRLWWSTRGTPVNFQHFSSAFFGPIALAVVAGGGMGATRFFTTGWGWAAQFATALGGGALTAVGLCVIWPQLLGEIQSVLRLRPPAGASSAKNSP